MQEVISFSVGNHRVAVEILRILVTEKFEKEPTQVPSDDPTLMGVANYQGASVPVYDLSLILDGITGRQRIDEVVEQLNAREADHVAWLDALRNAIETETDFNLARDPHQCAFGAWYDSFNSENQDLMHILRQFDEPHQRFHGMADELLAKAKNEGKEQALQVLDQRAVSTLGELQRLFQAAQETLSSCYKPVVVYTTQNGTKPDVGFVVDAVEDALSIDENDIKLFSASEDSPFAQSGNSSDLVVGLITKNNTNALLIEPHNLHRDQR